MRKITEQSAAAFLSGRNMSSGNMMVDHHAGYSAMYLHGNKIAERNSGGIHVSLAGWPTVTTRERINGLCVAAGSELGISQRNHRQMLVDGNANPIREIDNHEWVTI